MPDEGTLLGGKYRVVSVLGKGGMGVVVSARHEVLRHRVAIKLLSSAGKANPAALARFLREARATVELKSEHVVRIIDEGSHEGTPFLVMEFLEGEDLSQILSRRGVLPVEEAVEYLLQACDAMCEAHAQGVVHRDLKPSNLFLTRRADGRSLVKVLDFGISKLAPEHTDTELTETLAMLGSPTYMSPEQVRSSKTVDHRADIWAFGVVLFRLLTKHAPFEGQGGMAMCAAILSDTPKRPRDFRPELPEELEDVIMRCLEKDASRRYQQLSELGHALVPFAPDGITAARFRNVQPAAPLEPSSGAHAKASGDPPTNAALTSDSVASLDRMRPRSRVQWPWALGAAVLLLVGGAALVFATRGPAPESSAPTRAKEPAITLPPPSVKSAASATVAASVVAIPSVVEIASSAKPSAVVKTPVAKAPPGKASAAPKGKSWGTAIDDPL